MMDFPIISLMIFLPLVTALFIMIFVDQSVQFSKTIYIKYISVLSSLMTLIVSIFVMMKFDKDLLSFQFVERYKWFDMIGLEYHVGIDGISLLFVVLTALLTFICVLASLFTVENKVKEYLVCFLLLEAVTIGFFCSMNLLLFYIFFETMLIPMYLIIGVWGAENRVYAALKFFLYTFFGSVCFLVSLVYIYGAVGTFDMVVLRDVSNVIPLEAAKFVWIGMFISFAIKVPMFPFHTWLPDAHVQAPTGGSVILAGILLKVGGYAIVRILIPIFTEVSIIFSDVVIVLSLIGIVYGSFVAMAQTDMKKMIAYSSIAHMGYVTAGAFSFTSIGMNGAIFQMISHGIVSAGLFLVVGSLYHRMHTKNIEAYGGVAAQMPVLATFFMICMLGSVGLPGTSGFVGEFLSLVGMFQYFSYAAVIGATGVVLGAIYMLKLYRNVMLGEIIHPEVKTLKDLDRVEVITFLPIVFLVIYLGIQPGFVMSFLKTIDYITK